MATISVIVPVYKVENYIHHCVDSILGQTYTDFELILVDDGSPDNCGAICDEYAAKDRRVVVIHQENGGAAAARNAGLDIAGGAYIAFVDADDYLENHILETLLETLHKHNASCCMCGYTPIDEQGNKEQMLCADSVTVISGVQAIRERYLNHKAEYNIVNPWGKLFDAELWKGLRFKKGLYYEDLDVMPYLYYRCKRMVAIPENGYYYFLRSGSASRGTGTDNKRYIDSLYIREKHYGFYQSIGEYKLAISVAVLCLDLIITSACNGWIPTEEASHSKKVYRHFLKGVLRSDAVSVRNKVRYLAFGIVGAQGYKLLLNKGK